MLKGGASAELSQKKNCSQAEETFPLCVDPGEHFLLHGAPCNAGGYFLHHGLCCCDDAKKTPPFQGLVTYVRSFVRSFVRSCPS